MTTLHLFNVHPHSQKAFCPCGGSNATTNKALHQGFFSITASEKMHRVFTLRFSWQCLVLICIVLKIYGLLKQTPKPPVSEGITAFNSEPPQYLKALRLRQTKYASDSGALHSL